MSHSFAIPLSNLAPVGKVPLCESIINKICLNFSWNKLWINDSFQRIYLTTSAGWTQVRVPFAQIMSHHSFTVLLVGRRKDADGNGIPSCLYCGKFCDIVTSSICLFAPPTAAAPAVGNSHPFQPPIFIDVYNRHLYLSLVRHPSRNDW